MFDYSEQTYCIADVYKTIEQESYDTLGQVMTVVRFVYPPGISYTHLRTEREIPYTVYTLPALVKKVNSLGAPSVHLIHDDPIICGVQPLILVLANTHKVYMNTYGFQYLPEVVLHELSGIYLHSRPGLRIPDSIFEKAKEVNVYWNSEDPKIVAHVEALVPIVKEKGYENKMFLQPYNMSAESFQSTILKVMELGWRFGLRLSSVVPTVDSFLQSDPSVEPMFHARFYKDLVKAPKKKE